MSDSDNVVNLPGARIVTQEANEDICVALSIIAQRAVRGEIAAFAITTIGPTGQIESVHALPQGLLYSMIGAITALQHELTDTVRLGKITQFDPLKP